MELDATNRGTPADEVDATDMEAFYVLKLSSIAASFGAAVKAFGSMDTYIREGLGMTEIEIEALRNGFLDWHS